ncbi:hypothetical protein GF339_15145, partial [candidate division KSB3 bacterium]|nr:hypothetical protein [candidate division KSB3 bacterium]MBD3325921.1 hypothetical protein [candidate division KSB3 bacterium]
MSAFQPIPFADLIRRMFLEYQQHGKIFGLAKDKFFWGFPGEIFQTQYMGRRAATPFGPAAGPHTQLAQNLVLAWLTGARIMELKTVQILDELSLPRPCIDTENLGFNVEWSQELSLDESLREYVKAWMLIEMLKQSELLGEEFTRHYGDTIFDLSIGYDLHGITSERMHAYIQELQDAQKTIDALRQEIPEDFRAMRDLEYNPHIIESVTLSTFHGCAPDEIAKIVRYLLQEHRLNVIIKFNPTLLGQDEVRWLLHDVLGYTDLALSPDAFEQNLHFEQALEITKDAFQTAASLGKSLGLKFTNTLVVKNHKGYFGDDVMYLSGTPLHVIALRLLHKVRNALGDLHSHIQMSFSAGVDQKNFAETVSLNLMPVTACTDLLKAPGYAKGSAYLKNLGEQMRAVGAINLPDYVMKRFHNEVQAVQDVFAKLRHEAHQLGGELPQAERESSIQAQVQIFDDLETRILEALQKNDHSLELLTTDALIITDTLNTSTQKFGQSFLFPNTFQELYQSILAAAADRNLATLLEQTMHDPRYTAAKTMRTPKKLPSELALYDCTSCGRCIDICPNTANFAYYVKPSRVEYVNYHLTSDGVKEVAGGQFELGKFYQVANFDDCCNACSLCAIHCVEQGKPYQTKPKYFGSRAKWETQRESDGFFVERDAAT